MNRKRIITSYVLAIVLILALLYFWPQNLGRLIANHPDDLDFSVANITEIMIAERVNLFSLTGEPMEPQRIYHFTDPAEIEQVYNYLSSFRLVRRLTPLPTVRFDFTYSYTILLREQDPETATFETTVISFDTDIHGVTYLSYSSNRFGKREFRAFIDAAAFAEFLSAFIVSSACRGNS